MLYTIRRLGKARRAASGPIAETARSLCRVPLGAWVVLVASSTWISTALAEDDRSRPDDTDTPFVSEGFRQFEAGRPANALDAFRKALQDNANDLSALLGKAMVYSEQQMYEAAFDSYDAVVQRYPRHAFAWNGRGLAAFNLGNFDEALDSFEEATADRPVNGFFYESLAWTRMCRGEFPEAAESAKTAMLMYQREGETSLYPLLIAYFSYLEAGDEANAARSLRYALNNAENGEWPTPVLAYLAGEIDIPGLISFVSNRAEETEARTYIGLKLRADGRFSNAARQLDWVSERGDPRVFEYTLARTLGRAKGVALVRPSER